MADGGLPPDAVHEAQAQLIAQHGFAQHARIGRGVSQVAALWHSADGDAAAFVAFVLQHYVGDPAELDRLFARFESLFEQLDGHFLEIARELQRGAEVDDGPMSKVDPLLAAVPPAAHLLDQLFAAKAAFVALLNFPLFTLDELAAEAPRMSRRLWAEARLTRRFARRVPAHVEQDVAAARAAADLYVARYNLWMHHVVDAHGARLFPKGMRLVSHWNLRDELKAGYADPNGLARQRILAAVMERIVGQTIPQVVIDNPAVDWEPLRNDVRPADRDSVEPGTEASMPSCDETGPEPDLRYDMLRATFLAARRADPYSPSAPTQIARAFEVGAEMTQARVTALLTEVLESPLVGDVAAAMKRHLGRPLEPHDVWFGGFSARGSLAEAELDAVTRARYPDAAAFAADIPRILCALGFEPERARHVAGHIRVDPARGPGHAMPAGRRGDCPRLRTRIAATGMDYKAYNIAVHELGHNVEQVVSLYEVDHTLLAGVPNTAFTEAFAFLFQAKDLELLGYPAPDAENRRLRVLNDFWMTREIAGVALVELGIWQWLYAHPAASARELREATVAIAGDTWNRHYAPVLGGRDSVLLAIYSHMLQSPLYLFNYPLGRLVAFQIAEHMRTAGPFGAEFERIASQGAIGPDAWMLQATGAPVSAAPLLRATGLALQG